ncbi:P1 family peptidase [Actinophytocola sp.]|uniref:P1 family peptidase n=1 Tax=Actinophytocola sp. TaxID=1872138 RepID=UPI0038998EEF
MTEPRLARRSEFLPGALTNHDVPLVPQPSPGRGVVEFDLPGIYAGTAEYGEGPTGCTVIYVPKGARTAVDARGGAVGLSGGYQFHHAVVLAGGSVYGLEAAAGVSTELLHRAENRTHWAALAHVSGAVVYDFSTRATAIAPDAALGRAALENSLAGRVPVGQCGAGRATSVGKIDYDRAEFAGQGAAFGAFGDAKVLVVTVVNAVGVVVDRDGTVVRGNYHRDTGERRTPAIDYADSFTTGAVPARTVAGNTTLTVVVTNVRLTDVALRQFATQVHSSMHRAIQPFHTELDGDTLFALTTDEVELTGTAAGLGALASEVAWDAVLSSVA